MLRPKLKGKILFVFSDPGGAKPCLSLLKENEIVNYLAISDRTYSFYQDFSIPVLQLDMEPEEIIENFRPDLIFTGTSYTSNIERRFIAAAIKKNITCWSFVDHWTAISERFKNSSGSLILPSKVWVIDERAKHIAIKEGIDEKDLVIVGNPYHHWLKNWKPKISKSKFLEKIGLINQGKKLLVFAPDPLSNINGKEAFGFDELSASARLVDLFEKNKSQVIDWIVLIKMHPNQSIDKLNFISKDHKSFILVSAEVDVNETIFFADVVIGFFSSFLIEASIMNKPVLRFLEADRGNDPLAELKIGEKVNSTTLISEISRLLKWK